MPQIPVWFNPDLYATLDDLDLNPKECIAPRVKGGRCTIATGDTYKDASELRVQIEALPIGDERDELISEFLLLSCCLRCHRDKLRMDMACFRSLVGIYSEMLGSVELKENEVEERVEDIEEAVNRLEALSIGTEGTIPIPFIDTVSTSQFTQLSTPTTNVLLTTTSTQQETITLSQSSGISLRSGTILNPTTTSTTTVTLQWYQKPIPYFIPYTSLPSDSILLDLNLPIPTDHPVTGYIYTFTWPQYPGYTKLGYTAYSPASRIAEWQSCNPGAVLSRSFCVSWPKRIERLCHLELAASRFKIGRCRVCEKSHVEWFRLGTEVVEEVIEAWVKVAGMGLYTQNRKLSGEWKRRVERVNLPGGITARKLLDRVRADERRGEQSEDGDDDGGVHEVPDLKSEPSSPVLNDLQSEPRSSEHTQTSSPEQEKSLPDNHAHPDDNTLSTTITTNPQTILQAQPDSDDDSDNDTTLSIHDHLPPTNSNDDSDEWITEDDLDDEEITAILDLPDAFGSLRITQDEYTYDETNVHPDAALAMSRYGDTSIVMESDVIVDASGVLAGNGTDGDIVDEIRTGKSSVVRETATPTVDLSTLISEDLNESKSEQPMSPEASPNT